MADIKVETTLSLTAQIVIGSATIAFSLALMPFAIFYVHHFHRLRNANILKKRHVSLSITSCIFLILLMGIVNPLFIFQNTFMNISPDIILLIAKIIYQFLYPFTIHVPLWLMLARFWLTYFDFSWTKATLNTEWKVHINPKGCSTEQWFLNNKTRYGSLSKTRRKAWIISLSIASFIAILFILAIFTKILRPRYIQMIDNFLSLFPFISILIIWKKMPRIYDIMFYREEIRRLGLVMLLALILAFGNVVMVLINEDDVIATLYGGICLALYPQTVIFIQTYWVLYKIRKSKLYGNNMYKLENSYLSMSFAPTPTSTFYLDRVISVGSTTTDFKQRNKQKASMLPAILANKHAFDLFFQHLSAEFSMECLLAFTEFYQYRLLLESDDPFISAFQRKSNKNNTNNDNKENEPDMEHNDKKQNNIIVDFDDTNITDESSADGDIEMIKAADTEIDMVSGLSGRSQPTPISLRDDASIPDFSHAVTIDEIQIKQKKKRVYQTVKLPANIPQSIIVYGDRPNTIRNMQYYQIATELYNKYVKSGCEFEINVSYGMRYGVQHWLETNIDDNGQLNGNTEEGLYTLFDSCSHEIFKLMTHSCSRFVDSDQFSKIADEFFGDKM